MYKYTALLVFAALILCVSAQTRCDSARITAKARSDQYASWRSEDGFTSYQIFDLVVTNSGSCPITSIYAYFVVTNAGGSVSESWNYDKGAISGFGSALEAGHSFYGAGLVAANGSQITLALTRSFCESSCMASTAAPTNAPSTSAPSTSAPSTSAPSTSAPSSAPSTSAPSTSAPDTSAPSTSAPSTSSSTTSSSCRVSVSIKRDDASWIDSQGRNNTIHRINIDNVGTCPVSYYEIHADWTSEPARGSLISSWNLVGTAGGEQVVGFGDTLAVGASYSGAGMIIANIVGDVVFHYDTYRCTC